MTMIKHSQTGEICETTSRAWWTEGALNCGNGRIEIARVHAASTSLRRPSESELVFDGGSLAINRYESSPNYTGKRVQYMIGLTESELLEYAITPGILQWPNIVDGERPASSHTVFTEAQYEAALHELQNEGHDDTTPPDNTPYQKGDDQLDSPSM